MENKICKNCGIEKNNNKFPKTGRLCKICFNEYMRNRRPRKYEKNIDENYKICRDCNIEKNINDFNIKHAICKKCYNKKRKDISKNYYKNNKDRILKNNKKYVDNNKEERKKYMRDYIKNKRNLNADFKLISNIKSITYSAFKKNGYSKNTKTFNILGCSFEEFKIYIISKFELWMTLDNYGIYTGNYNETWQLDHIIPISNATTPEDIIRLNHYTNFQPLCSKKNLEKSNYCYSIVNGVAKST